MFYQYYWNMCDCDNYACISFPGWNGDAKGQIPLWRNIYIHWLNDYNGPLYILHFENLKSNLKEELHKLAVFLNQNVTENDVGCVIANQLGNFKRKTDHTAGFDPFTEEMKQAVDDNIDIIYKCLIKREGKDADIMLSMKSDAYNNATYTL